MRPRVHTEKHIVQRSLFAIVTGTISNIALARSVSTPAAASILDVREGCIITAVYVEMWVTSDDNAAGTVITTLEKVPSNAPSMTAADSADLNGYQNKNNILYTQMGLIPNNDTYPMVVIRGWFKIPKGKQRFALGDELVLNVHAQSNGISACGTILYKEQY